MCIYIDIMGGKLSKPKPPPPPLPSFDDRQHIINSQNRQLSSLGDTLSSEYATRSTVYDKISYADNVNQQLDQESNRLTGIKREKKNTVNNLIDPRIPTQQHANSVASDNIDTLIRTAELNNSVEVTTILGVMDRDIQLVANMQDTNAQNRNIYLGMNKINHSLNSTIINNKNNQTTDVSRLAYQYQQTEYFSALNKLLLISYMILLFLFLLIVVFFKIPINMSVYMKLFTLLLLLVLPFISVIYYRYNV